MDRRREAILRVLVWRYDGNGSLLNELKMAPIILRAGQVTLDS